MSDGQGATSAAPEPAAARPDGRPVKAGRPGRRLLVRIAVWSTGAVVAVAAAVLAVDAATESRGTALTVDTLTRQLQGAQQAAQDRSRELRRLAAAVETLNHDRDRLFARVTALEREADIATGSIAGSSTVAKTDSSRLPAVPAAAPSAAMTAGTAPETPPVGEAKAEPVAPDPLQLAAADAAAPVIALDHTEFGIDLGASTTVNGLRRLWATALKAHKDDFASLSPALAVRERPGGRVEFRLLVGPLQDAADAARLCATLNVAKRPCVPAVFDGQRLELTEAKADLPSPGRRPQPKAADNAADPAPAPPRP
jgi:hypothetical protein